MSREFDLKSGKEDGRVLHQLAEITDGMSLVDLRNLAALSRQGDNEQLDIPSLVNLYRLEKESPWTQLDEQRVSQAGDIIRQRVKGQDEAVDRVVTMIIRAFLGLAGVQHSRKMTKPKGTLFFVGPTGVGKTDLLNLLQNLSLEMKIIASDSTCLNLVKNMQIND